MPKGNPDPSPETRFEAGRSGNPGGKTSAQRQAEVDAAEKAALIQKAMLDALADEVAADPENALAAIKGDPLKLIKDAMDRAYGTAVQKVASTSPDGETSSVDWDLLTLEQKKAVLAARKENESDPNEG